MAVIFLLSHQPDLSTGLQGWDTVLRKLAHMAEYGVLWLLWWRAFGYAETRAAIVGTVLIAVGYAVTDEVHQSFVTGRHGTPVDWVIDAAGVGVAALIVVRFGDRWPVLRGERRRVVA